MNRIKVKIKNKIKKIIVFFFSIIFFLIYMISSLPILKKPSKRTIGIGAMITEIREMSTTKKPPKPKAPTIPFSEYITLKRD